MPAKTYLSPEQLAERLGMSVRTVYRLASEERVPFYRAGRLLRFDLDEVLAAMRERPAA